MSFGHAKVELHIPDENASALSNALQKLVKSGVLKMVRRGTYVKL